MLIETIIINQSIVMRYITIVEVVSYRYLDSLFQNMFFRLFSLLVLIFLLVYFLTLYLFVELNHECISYFPIFLCLVVLWLFVEDLYFYYKYDLGSFDKKQILRYLIVLSLYFIVFCRLCYCSKCSSIMCYFYCFNLTVFFKYLE